MPRQPRLDIPGIPQHVIQRSNDRQPCLFAEVDYRCYLPDLRELALKGSCCLHAYTLMTHHIHLLLTADKPAALSRLM